MKDIKLLEFTLFFDGQEIKPNTELSELVKNIVMSYIKQKIGGNKPYTKPSSKANPELVNSDYQQRLINRYNELRNQNKEKTESHIFATLAEEFPINGIARAVGGVYQTIRMLKKIGKISEEPSTSSQV